MDAERSRSTLLAYVIGAVVLVLLGLRVFGGAGSGDPPAVALDGATAQARPEQRPPGGKLWVHVAGAVRRPGLYRVAGDARAGVAVDAAGGLTRRADTRAVNLAATVRDGQQIIVPARGERSATSPPPAAASTPGASADPGGGAAAGGKVSLASATLEQLDGLDGIGPTLAKRILEWREAHGGFKSVEQLREVEGIGEKRFAALREAVVP